MAVPGAWIHAIGEAQPIDVDACTVGNDSLVS